MKNLWILLLGMLVFSPAHADTVRLEVGTPLARFAKLHPGVHRYLRYTIGADGSRKSIDIWQRTISIGPDAQGSPDGMHIVQRWDRVDGRILLQDSWFDLRTLKPRTHIRHTVMNGKDDYAGYRFADGKVIGMAELAGNNGKDFVLPLPELSYNFENDMELLQALPLAAGRTFDIPFYDPGIDRPARYKFTVAGSDTIPGPDGRAIDCWLVTADYNKGNIVARFWFAKTNQVLIREESPRDGGTTLVKTLLPAEADDRQID